MRNYLLFICLTISSLSQAQTLTQTIKGKITDNETGQAIVGAIVTVGDNSVISDENGYFNIERIAIGRYSIKVNCVGYENTTINELLVNSGKEVELNIKLVEQIQQLGEVKITAQKEHGAAINDMASVSVRSFSVEQTKRYAASWSDPARMALSFAGTSNVNDQSNEIVIRGNSPKGLLWRIDGVEIPNPNHFSSEGASGGGISALSANVLSNSDFYTGAFPAEYGNASSGVFDLKMRNGNGDKREHTIQLGFQGLDFATEGPFSSKSKASYLTNYRYSTLQILDKLGLSPVKTANPSFQDGAFKIFFPFKKTAISLWGMGGLSSSNFKPVSNYSSTEGSNFYATGLNIVYYVNPKSYWENIFSTSGNQVINQTAQTDIGYDVNKKYGYRYLRYSTLYNYKINSKNTVRLGGIISQIGYDVIDRTKSIIDNKPQEYTLLDDRDKTYLLQGYLQWKYRLNTKLTFNSGLHFMYLTLNKNSSIEPRFGLKYQTTDKSTLNFGLGIHSRIDPITTYMLRTRAIGLTNTDYTQLNKDLQIPKSAHIVLGYEHRPSAAWRINTEVYYQHHYQAGILAQSVNSTVPVLLTYSSLNDLSGFQTFPVQSNGIGKSYGLELTVERFLTNGFYLLSTTSLYNATYQGRDGIERTARFSNNFVQNILAGKEWKIGKLKKNMLTVNIKTTYAGGIRVVPIDLATSAKLGYQVNDYANSYQQQLSNFFRTDTRIGYVINKHKRTSTFSLDLQNITNHNSPKQIFYDNATKQIITIFQLGLLPIFNYRIEF